MDYRRLGSTGLKVSRLGLGCGNFGGIGSAPEFFGKGENEAQAFALMDRAFDAGINFFDTADAYGGGRSETYIGRWLQAKGPARAAAAAAQLEGVQSGRPRTERSRAVAPAHPAAGRREPRAAADRSARHVPDPRARSRDAARGNARRARRSRARGQGALRRREQHRSVAAGARAVDQRHAAAWSASSGCRTPTACSTGRPSASCFRCAPISGVGFTAFSPLAGGWLTGKYRSAGAYPEGSRMTLRPEPYRHLDSDSGLRRPGGARRAKRARAASR